MLASDVVKRSPPSRTINTELHCGAICEETLELTTKSKASSHQTGYIKKLGTFIGMAIRYELYV